jgi:Ca-activated chloride channel family protein
MLYFVHSHRGQAARHGNLSLWLLFRCLPAVVMAGLVFLVLSASPARARLPDWLETVAPATPEAGHMVLRDEHTGRSFQAVLLSSKVHFDISGLVATAVLEQRFHNATDRWLEGVYAFPLPENAAVRYLEMAVGERRIIGKVRERGQASAIYKEAKREGRKASLVEQQRPNLFTNRVVNIGPGEEISVQLHYVQPVDYRAGGFSLRFPMTITARYMPGPPLAHAGDSEGRETLAPDAYLGWAVPTDQVADADAISPYQHARPGSDRTPINPVEISASLDPGLPLASVESPYHQITLRRRAGVYQIELANRLSEMDRDFVLNWRPVTGARPAAAVFTERVGEDYFGLLMLLPPAVERLPEPAPRELVFVMDTSGSMAGVSIEQARASLSQALLQLRPEDRFNVIAFDNHPYALYRQPMPATRHHVARAREFVRQLSASGGTEMLPALRVALAPETDSDLYREQPAIRQVIFITDGAVGNEVALFEEISARLGDSRLFTVGIGSAPNSRFMRKAAEFGRGSHTHIGRLEEVGEKMDTLFDHISSPVALNLGVRWPVAAEVWPQRLPDLYAGQPLVLAANFGSQPPVGEVEISADIDGRPWHQTLALFDGEDPRTASSHPGVGNFWARSKITGLLDQKLAGRDEASVRADVLTVALQHQLLSPYTSFIAIEERVSRPTDQGLDRSSVPNTRPRGQAAQTYAYPATATTAPAKAWLAALALFLALMICVLRRPELDHVPSPRA